MKQWHVVIQNGDQSKTIKEATISASTAGVALRRALQNPALDKFGYLTTREINPGKDDGLMIGIVRSK
jgi:hypothetical protein